jgi:hypothetical protein
MYQHPIITRLRFSLVTLEVYFLDVIICPCPVMYQHPIITRLRFSLVTLEVYFLEVIICPCPVMYQHPIITRPRKYTNLRFNQGCKQLGRNSTMLYKHRETNTLP